MVHFYESSIITTKQGLDCQVYGNEHPFDSILVKPKYIPTDKIESSALPYRFLHGKKMNRLNLWINKEELKKYIQDFKINYPQYVFNSEMHGVERLFFSVPINEIERIYFPRKGLSELMSMPENNLDPHLHLVYNFVNLLLQSGLRIKDLGITYSTLMGHYSAEISDINIVVYGKEKYWELMGFLKTAKHPLLRWKTEEEWKNYHKQRNRFGIYGEEDFVKIMMRKNSEGFFNDRLFVIFAAEKEEETWFKWGEETYTSLGPATVEGTVTDNFSSVVRPGCYLIKDSKVLKVNFNENKNYSIRKVVFYSRDYCQILSPGEKLQAHGLLEEVQPKQGEKYYRLVVGYFDAYISERREKEYIKIKEK